MVPSLVYSVGVVGWWVLDQGGQDNNRVAGIGYKINTQIKLACATSTHTGDTYSVAFTSNVIVGVV